MKWPTLSLNLRAAMADALARFFQRPASFAGFPTVEAYRRAPQRRRHGKPGAKLARKASEGRITIRH